MSSDIYDGRDTSELGDAGNKALEQLQRTLVAQGIPKDERDAYEARFRDEIAGMEDEQMIKTVLGRLLLETMKRARTLKESRATGGSEKKETGKINFCTDCGAPVSSPSANFCTSCGHKLQGGQERE